MPLTRRTGLIIIVGLAITGGILVATTGAIADARVRDSLVTIRESYLPRMKLGPKLDAKLERIGRGFKDAVAAKNPEGLSVTHMWLDEVSEVIAAAQPSLSSSDAGALRKAFKTYYAAGLVVARGLMNNATGDSMLQAIKDMQESEKRTGEVIVRITGVDPNELDNAFADIVGAQTLVARVRLGIIVGFLTVIAIVAVFLAQHLATEEQRRDELMAQAARELEALSAPTGLHTEAIDLAKLAHDCGSALAKANAPRVVELCVDGAMLAEIEPGLARLLFDALLTHAWKATSATPGARVEVGSLTAAGDVAYYVRNNGGGLAANSVRGLFVAPTVFANLRTERSELATAQRVVRRCGGRIWAENLSGERLAIHFTLPPPQNRLT